MSVGQNLLEFQDEFDSEIRAIRIEAESISECLSITRYRVDFMNEKSHSNKEADDIIFESILVRLDRLQRSVVLNRRLCALEGANRRSPARIFNA
jgi:hypothetical protein